MTTKQAIIASLVTIAGVIGLGILVAVLFIDIQAPGADKRAAQLGSGFGTLAMFPFAFIWWKWAMTIRAQREAASRPKSRKRSRSDSGSA